MSIDQTSSVPVSVRITGIYRRDSQSRDILWTNRQVHNEAFLAKHNARLSPTRTTPTTCEWIIEGLDDNPLFRLLEEEEGVHSKVITIEWKMPGGKPFAFSGGDIVFALFVARNIDRDIQSAKSSSS